MSFTHNNIFMYALVTGGSSGIGFAMSVELAKKGYHIINVSLDDANDTKSTLSECFGHINIYFIQQDLTDDNAIQNIIPKLPVPLSDIDVVINNAGFDVPSTFENAKSYDPIIHCNIRAVTELARVTMAQWRNTKTKKYMLFTSSMCGESPVPNHVVYAATKSYVTALSNGIYYENNNKNIHVTCLKPGGTRTQFFGKNDQTFLHKLHLLHPPEYVASQGLQTLFNQQREVTPGILNKMYSYCLVPLFPMIVCVQLASFMF